MVVKINGTIGHGDGYGEKLGFPTANLDRRSWSHLKKKPTLGIHAGRASVGKNQKKYKAAIVVGPMDDKGLPKIEAYLLGFTGNLYGVKCELSFIKYLRKFMSFTDTKSLKKQIARDVVQVKSLINL